jgi:hypothetical protein
MRIRCGEEDIWAKEGVSKVEWIKPYNKELYGVFS